MPTSARWEPSNSPQISVKPACTARADVGIGPYKPVSNIGTISYRESIGLAPEQGVQAASGQKTARVSVQYNASPAPLFSPFFSGKAEKNGPAERQLRCTATEEVW